MSKATKWKEVTLPITPRQLGWISFGIIVGLMDYGLVSAISATILYQKLNVTLLILINILFPIIAFWVDEKYDMNPIHWIGYCLRLKESK